MQQNEKETGLKDAFTENSIPANLEQKELTEQNYPTERAIGTTDTRSARSRKWTSLESITVKNFKAVREATIPLDSVTILVGPNGCGKSSVLQAIHWAARAASYVSPRNTKEMISFDRLDYLPSSEPLTTLNNGELKSDSASTPVEVIFEHQQVG